MALYVLTASISKDTKEIKAGIVVNEIITYMVVVIMKSKERLSRGRMFEDKSIENFNLHLLLTVNNVI